MKMPNGMHYVVFLICAFICDAMWPSVSAMTIGSTSVASFTASGMMGFLILSAVILAVIGSLTSTPNALRRLRSAHTHPHSASMLHAAAGELRTPEYAVEDRVIYALRKQVFALKKENDRLQSVLQEQNARLMQDPLTGIPNRLAYEERLQQEFKRWLRFAHPLTLLVWDIDHFKRINDQHGHAIGDTVLRNVAQQLASRIRGTDIVARFGGEEFVMLLPGADQTAALQLADEIRAAIAISGTVGISATISCGLTVFQQGDTPESAFLRADHALYASKHAGRNRCTIE